jgi:hypothetical protein
MANAYFALRAVLPGDQRSVLLANQRRWIDNRNSTCSDKEGNELVGCVLGQTEERRGFLAGEGPNPAAAPRIQPAFFQETKKDYNIDVVYPHILKPNSPGDQAFNKAAQDLALRDKTLADIRTWKPGPGSSGGSYESTTYRITYCSPRLATLVYTLDWYYAGTAHPDWGSKTLVFDFALGRRLALADVVDEPPKAIAAISRQCKSAWGAGTGYDFAETVSDFHHWAPEKDALEILFDEYTVAGHGAGWGCRLPWGDVSQWLKPGGPLPPHEN